MEINPKLINEFQKAISQFNQKIVANKEPTINDDLLAQLPQTEMEENKYKFTRPQHMANASLIDNQVRTCLMKPPRVRKPTSAYKSTVGLANEKQFAIKRVQSGNLLRRSDTQGSRIFSAALPKNPSQAEFTKATGENKSKFLLKGNKA